MLKLEYRRVSDIHQTVTVIGSPVGISDLYWQLCHNYSERPDGAAICNVSVSNLDGLDVTEGIMQKRYERCTNLDKNIDC